MYAIQPILTEMAAEIRQWHDLVYCMELELVEGREGLQCLGGSTNGLCL